MSRNRITYNNIAVFASQTTGVLDNQNSGDLLQLNRVQSLSFDFTKNYENINELGSLSPITNLEVEYPTINLNLTYLVTNQTNEKRIGFTVDNIQKNFLEDIIKYNYEKNYYVLIGPEGYELNDSNNLQTDIIGFGNTCLTSYQVSAEVGALPTVEIGLNALNIKYYKNPSKIWVVYDIINPFSNNLYNGKVKIVNFDNINNLMIVTQPEDYLYSSSYGPKLYIDNNNNWSSIGNLTGVLNFTDGINSAKYGRSVTASDSGKYIVIGGPDSDDYTGSALLYARSGNSNNWNLVKKLSGVGNGAIGPIYSPYGARYGTNVSISKSGDIIMMNGPYDEGGYGGALIYTGTNWNTPAYKLTGSQPYILGLGSDMNADGSVIILGGGAPVYFDGLTDIFTGNKNIGWKLAQSITGENGGQHGRNCAINDKGDVIVLNGPNEGSCLIYTGNAVTKWGFAQKITGMNINSNNNLSINSDGSTIVFGSDYDYNSSIGNGMISIYTGNAQNKWSLYQIVSGKNDGDYFGHDVAVNYSGDIIASLAPGQYEIFGGDFGLVNVLNKKYIQGLPSIDPEEIINPNNLYFGYPNPQINNWNPQITNSMPFALNPGDIQLQVTGVVGYDNIDLKIQSFSFSFELDRTPLKKLGQRYPFTREINFPIKGELKINALIGDLESKNLNDIICDQKTYEFVIQFWTCNIPGLRDQAIRYGFRKLRLVSQNFTSTIGDNTIMEATYEADLSNIDRSPTQRSTYIF